MQEISKVVFK